MVVVFPKSNKLIQLRSGEARPVEKIPKAETLGAIQDEVNKLKTCLDLMGGDRRRSRQWQMQVNKRLKSLRRLVRFMNKEY